MALRSFSRITFFVHKICCNNHDFEPDFYFYKTQNKLYHLVDEKCITVKTLKLLLRISWAMKINNALIIELNYATKGFNNARAVREDQERQTQMMPKTKQNKKIKNINK